jgi:GMP synthase-like glutamine amidotransferase
MENRILSIQNISIEDLGNLEELIRLDGYQIENIEAQKQTVPVDVDKYAAIIILGGPMAVYDNLEYLEREQKLIRQALEEETPVLGICLGSQLIAQAIGGNVYKGQKKEIGWSSIMLNQAGYEDLFMGTETNSINVFQWHGDTYDLPSNAVILASSDLYPQAFRFGSAIGVQFHVEINDKMIRRWAEEYKQELKKERIEMTELLDYREQEMINLFEICKLMYSNFSKQIKKKVTSR